MARVLTTAQVPPSKQEDKAVQAEIAVRPVPVGIAHLNLRTFVLMHPHSARMWKRNRTLPAPKPSHRAEMEYRRQLHTLVGVLSTNTFKHLLPVLRSEFAANGRIIGDAAKMMSSSRVRMALEDNRKRTQNIDAVADKITKSMVSNCLKDTDARLTNVISKSLGVNIRPAFTNDGPIRTNVQTATNANVALIKSIPEQYHTRIETLVEANYLAGVHHFEDLAEGIQHIADVTDTRAKLIARDQTGKLNASFSRARMQSVGINRYTWQTSGDEFVRETHAENDGQVFSYDDPPEETGNPGDDVNCRCIANPYFDLDALEEEAGE